MLATFLATKKTTENRSFILVLLVFILWTGGSIMMRLQIFPGVAFWFYVSILAIFTVALMLYLFVCSFVDHKGYFLKTVWICGTVIILLLTALGVFLEPPTVQVQPSGETVFLYEMKMQIVIPCIFFFCIIISFIRLVFLTVRENGVRTPGLLHIIIGCITLVAGNMLQIIPGNIFPWDTLSGIVFAVFLMYALYKKRVFKMTLLISRSALLLISGAICFLMAAYFITPIDRFVALRFPVESGNVTAVVVVIFSILFVGTYTLLRRLIFSLFSRDEQQGRQLKEFSGSVSQTLDTSEIMTQLAKIIREEIPVSRVYICLAVGNNFVAKYRTNPLDSLSFSLSVNSACVNYLKKGKTYFLMSEFQSSPLYRSLWQSERELYSTLGIQCVVALKDGKDIVGIILLPAKDKRISYTNVELSFLDTVSSIASIAMKNAVLYERMYREARIDSLTGVYNFKYFLEKVNAEFEVCKDSSLALIFFDIDDLKLYNQLYGTEEGDFVLRKVADTLVNAVGESGTIFRHSGKIFAALLPGYDVRKAKALATEVQKQIMELGNIPDKQKTKSISLSGGICVAPYAASSAKELIENADLAVFNAKSNGKGKINVFVMSTAEPMNVTERAMQIVERGTRRDESTYAAYSSTVLALTAAIDAKDHYTYNHSRNVAFYSSVLATAAGLNDDQIRMIYEAALLHDIGKISIPETILSKGDRLTDEEYRVMKSHVNNSIEMIRHLPSMDYVIPAAIGHHERWDGKGYPRGIAGESIPIGARCLAIADAFDAMTSDRPYRKGMSIEFAVEQIEKGAGSQFDPKLAQVFVELIRNGDISKSMAFVVNA
jgi:diguanylate cyclase (GGDEF)-like protein/putative nucleotidyltransferase with HDIG domain